MKQEDPGPIKDKKVKEELEGPEYGPIIDSGLQSLDKALAINPNTTTRWPTRICWSASAPTSPNKKEEYEKQTKIADDWVQKAWPPRRSRPKKESKTGGSIVVDPESNLTTIPVSRSGESPCGAAPLVPQMSQDPHPYNCYNRIRVPPESASVSEPVPPPHSADPVEQLYRELEASSANTGKETFHRPSKRLFVSPARSRGPRFATPASPTWCIPHGGPLLADMQMDLVAMETGLLHDVVEDNSNVSADQVRKEFGEDVARCVDGVTKLTKLDFFPPRNGRPRASAKCSWPWWKISGSSWSNWPTACTICGRSVTSTRSGGNASPERPSKSTLHRAPPGNG